jgi:filamentous hemagglutinin family protein
MNRSQSFVGLVLLASIGFPKGAIAQVVRDNTVGTSVNAAGNIFTINGGTRSGNNLFHSFSQFSIPTNGSAIFNNATDVQNIFSRVTGSSASNIDGLIKANGNASLFLMNPNGIVFGPKATLEIGGSFIGTTANSIKFKDGVEFSSGNLTANPLLTISVPIGLQMGQNPGAIEVKGAQLNIPAGQTLALVGGDIRQTGGKLNVAGGNGRIELASLGENSTTELQAVPSGWAVNSRNAQTFRDMQFTQKAWVGSDGNGSASITAVGRNLFMDDESWFQSYNRGSLPGGAIAVNMSSSVLLQEKSALRSEVEGSGNGGNISIAAPKITLYNGAEVVSAGWKGTANAGDILLQGQDVTVSSDPKFLKDDRSTRGSAIVTLGFGQGNTANITILTDTLTYSNGAGLANLAFGKGNGGTTTLKSRTMTVHTSTGGGFQTFGPGNGGDLNIITDSFYMDGSSGYTTASYAKEGGKAGNINLTAKSIVSRDDGGFNTDTFGGGKAGNIIFKADYIELDDTQLNSRTNGSGNAGMIDVTAQTLRLLNGSQLNVSTKASGTGGGIIVNANTVELNGEPLQGKFAEQNTGIISGVLLDPKNPNAQTGNGGEITINAATLLIRDGAAISASTKAGQGNGGDITLNVDRLEAFNGGQVMAVTESQGNAGIITINARDRILLSGKDAFFKQRQVAYVDNVGSVDKNGLIDDYSDVDATLAAASGIFANATTAATGSGGNLKITTGELRVQEDAIVNVSSRGSGNAGNFTVNANQVRLNQGSIQSESTAGTQGNLFFNLNEALLLRNGSTITTNATGNANGGNININSPIILGLENSDIIANAVRGRGGNITITTQGIIGMEFRNTLTPRTDSTNDITASSEFNVNGNIQVNTIGINPTNTLNALPADVVSSTQMSDRCAAAKTSSFISTGRGGIPQKPIQRVKTDRPWRDLRPTIATTSTPIQPLAAVPPTTQLVEASAIEVDETGAISLVTPQSIHPNPATCATSMGNP